MTATCYFEDLSVGMDSAHSREVTMSDIQAFAELSGDDNPIHLDEDYASATMFEGCIAHGMLSAAFISKVLGTQLPGTGSIYLSQMLKFKAPVRPGETVETRVVVTELDGQRRRATLACECRVKDVVVVAGEAVVMVPSRPVEG